jgi:hypothetical protein
MSLLGKILAFMNILGAVGLLSLAAMDYSKRRAWAYSLTRHDLVITGLPLDAEQIDQQGRPLAEQLSDEVLDDVFSGLGSRVATQSEELQRIRGELDRRFSTATTPGQKVRVGATLLLPLARNYVDREQLLVCRKEFADDKSEAAFKKRLLDAYLFALLAPRVEGKEPDPEKDKEWAKGLPAAFEQRFRQALRDDARGPADPFAGAIAAQTLEAPGFFDKPELFASSKDLTAKFDEFFTKAVATQGEAMQARFKEAFDEAEHGPKGLPGVTPPKNLLDARRTAVARLMFNLAPLLAEQPGAATGVSAGEQDKVLATPGYAKVFQRLVTVVGLEATANAIAEQAQLLQAMSGDLNKAMSEERLNFVAAHSVLLELVRDRAYLVETELALLAREEQNLADLKGVVERRKKDVKLYEDQLTDMRAATAVEVKKLQAMSQKLYDLRVLLRDTRIKNSQGEREIRELENKIREMQNR